MHARCRQMGRKFVKAARPPSVVFLLVEPQVTTFEGFVRFVQYKRDKTASFWGQLTLCDLRGTQTGQKVCRIFRRGKGARSFVRYNITALKSGL